MLTISQLLKIWQDSRSANSCAPLLAVGTSTFLRWLDGQVPWGTRMETIARVIGVPADELNTVAVIERHAQSLELGLATVLGVEQFDGHLEYVVEMVYATTSRVLALDRRALSIPEIRVGDVVGVWHCLNPDAEIRFVAADYREQLQRQRERLASIAEAKVG